MHLYDQTALPRRSMYRLRFMPSSCNISYTPGLVRTVLNRCFQVPAMSVPPNILHRNSIVSECRLPF